MTSSGLVTRLSFSQVNQARSMMLAQLSVGPAGIDEDNRKAHGQVMELIIPSTYLRAVIGVLVGIGVNVLGRLADLDSTLLDMISWTLVLAIPCVAVSVWVLLLLRRIRKQPIRAVTDIDSGPLVLFRASLAGYAVSATTGVLGVAFFPQHFL